MTSPSSERNTWLLPSAVDDGGEAARAVEEEPRRVAERPAAAQGPGAAPARARVGPRHLEAEVAAGHLEVRRLLDEVPVEEVDPLDERAAHREDGAVDEAQEDLAVGDHGLGRVLGVARLHAERRHLLALELGEARGHEDLVQAGGRARGR